MNLRSIGVYNLGSTVTLTAKANSGSSFTGWSGACIGNAPTCAVTMNAESAVTASFAAVVAGGGGGGGGATGFKLSVAKSNSGTVTSTPAGINCGNTCTATFGAGNAVTLTATPPPGLVFLGWRGIRNSNALFLASDPHRPRHWASLMRPLESAATC